MTCPECGWPKRERTADECWRADTAKSCRRFPEPEPAKSAHGVPVKLHRYKNQIANDAA